MKRSFILFLILSAANVFGQNQYQPTLASLQQYKCPEWFHDAKFGIYVHWGVYSVAEHGEWYAREMYIEGHKVYKYHLENYGHPSEFGYKDLIPLWEAEKFDPDSWLALFKEAGARYFTPCAVHHDGFELWDSKYTPYNAVNMGPKKDLLGMMRTATLKCGLRFGVTTHVGRSLSWMQTSHRSDTSGSFKGIPYDGNDPVYQDLYHIPYGDDNRADTENPPLMWRYYWLLRMKDLVENYQPDFIYLDSAIPFAGEDHGKTGFEFFAWYYNLNQTWHHGAMEGVITHKGNKGPKRAPYFEGIATLDIERGKSKHIRKQPWQTDDSIGPWGYNKTVGYKDANAIIDKMIDIVSKNGNLLLNVPPRADGTLDDKTVTILKQIGAWFSINGEGIYETRPWEIFGEGSDTEMGKHDNLSPYTHENIRYTQSKDGKIIYAILMGCPKPNSAISLTAFGKDNPGDKVRIKEIKMLGSDEVILFKHTNESLTFMSPAKCKNDLAVVYKIKCLN
jgi:alpha-L-fucosidase